VVENKFDKSYFVGGTKSNYIDYRQKKYDGLAKSLINELSLKKEDRILDFGCGTGALLHELFEIGIRDTRGTDASTWAVNFGREQYGFSFEQLQYLNMNLFAARMWDYVFALDVAEHLGNADLGVFFDMIEQYPPNKGVVVRIPVAQEDGGAYVLPVSENDPTHIQRLTRASWVESFEQRGYTLTKLFNTEPFIWDTPGVLAGVFKK